MILRKCYQVAINELNEEKLLRKVPLGTATCHTNLPPCSYEIKIKETRQKLNIDSVFLFKINNKS